MKHALARMLCAAAAQARRRTWRGTRLCPIVLHRPRRVDAALEEQVHLLGLDVSLKTRSMLLSAAARGVRLARPPERLRVLGEVGGDPAPARSKSGLSAKKIRASASAGRFAFTRRPAMAAVGKAVARVEVSCAA